MACNYTPAMREEDAPVNAKKNVQVFKGNTLLEANAWLPESRCVSAEAENYVKVLHSQSIDTHTANDFDAQLWAQKAHADAAEVLKNAQWIERYATELAQWVQFLWGKNRKLEDEVKALDDFKKKANADLTTVRNEHRKLKEKMDKLKNGELEAEEFQSVPRTSGAEQSLHNPLVFGREQALTTIGIKQIERDHVVGGRDQASDDFKNFVHCVECHLEYKVPEPHGGVCTGCKKEGTLADGRLPEAGKSSFLGAPGKETEKRTGGIICEESFRGEGWTRVVCEFTNIKPKLRSTSGRSHVSPALTIAGVKDSRLLITHTPKDETNEKLTNEKRNDLIQKGPFHGNLSLKVPGNCLLDYYMSILDGASGKEDPAWLCGPFSHDFGDNIMSPPQIFDGKNWYQQLGPSDSLVIALDYKITKTSKCA